MKRRDFVKASFGAGVLTLTVRLEGGKSSETALPQQLSRTSLTYPIVDTGQTLFYDNFREIPQPKPGEPFYGQDAHFSGNQPRYKDNGDGTVTDLVTGLVWQKSFSVMTYEEALTAVEKFRLAGYDDWRLPTIKELYSLILFSGVDPSGPDMTKVPPQARPFIHEVFDFRYGANGPRIIDTQFLSSTVRLWEGRLFVYGVNFADGRIKSYPVLGQGGEPKKFCVRFVRGNPEYGKNRFRDNGDGTVTDLATGLMWEKSDSGYGMTWQEALEYAQEKNRQKHLGYSDWRLPNAKELQSLVDYGRFPAISDLFECTQITNEAGEADYPYYWTSTTHLSVLGGARDAVYICFGKGLGYMPQPGGTLKAVDVHGAGAQRSDPKTGNPKNYPKGRGPQGDVVRIYNFVRLVRDVAK